VTSEVTWLVGNKQVAIRSPVTIGMKTHARVLIPLVTRHSSLVTRHSSLVTRSRLLDAGAQRREAVDEIFVAALDKFDVVDLATARGGKGGKGKGGAGA